MLLLSVLAVTVGAAISNISSPVLNRLPNLCLCTQHNHCALCTYCRPSKPMQPSHALCDAQGSSPASSSGLVWRAWRCVVLPYPSIVIVPPPPPPRSARPAPCWTLLVRQLGTSFGPLVCLKCFAHAIMWRPRVQMHSVGSLWIACVHAGA